MNNATLRLLAYMAAKTIPDDHKAMLRKVVYGEESDHEYRVFSDIVEAAAYRTEGYYAKKCTSPDHTLSDALTPSIVIDYPTVRLLAYMGSRSITKSSHILVSKIIRGQASKAELCKFQEVVAATERALPRIGTISDPPETLHESFENNRSTADGGENDDESPISMEEKMKRRKAALSTVKGVKLMEQPCADAEAMTYAGPAEISGNHLHCSGKSTSSDTEASGLHYTPRTERLPTAQPLDPSSHDHARVAHPPQVHFADGLNTNIVANSPTIPSSAQASLPQLDQRSGRDMKRATKYASDLTPSDNMAIFRSCDASIPLRSPTEGGKESDVYADSVRLEVIGETPENEMALLATSATTHGLNSNTPRSEYTPALVPYNDSSSYNGDMAEVMPQTSLHLPIKDGSTKNTQAPSVLSGKRQGFRRCRTGCLTCRRRKKKCDEVKPDCGRCITTGTLCEGSGYRHHLSAGVNKPLIPYPANSCLQENPSLTEYKESPVQYASHLSGPRTPIIEPVNCSPSPSPTCMLDVPEPTDQSGPMAKRARDVTESTPRPLKRHRGDPGTEEESGETAGRSRWGLLKAFEVLKSTFHGYFW